ncbi:Lysophospholipase L1 [Ekhidna lutea]|uniref:Lysophospholipase L1 n=1 Tax=Ekhidna lutea TaxID=447679 RepID=A0A239H8D0_EKHLU|nr:SGNH/GDSL hydrolase family protein [Ekhidna lutea]SNS77620.1 Lysophospholipase L1 [Ekhidna lutea]
MRLIIILCFLIFTSCATQKTDSMKEDGFIHLALGDSYTIGEAVDVGERWPVQLARRLRKDSIQVDPVIVATTGWTTDELLAGIVKADVEGTYDFVSLLIGVNNQYRGYPIDQYEKEFKQLLDQAIQFAGGNPYNVMVVSIPDYGVTPFATKKMLDEEKIARELDNYNAIAEKITKLRDVKFIDITPGSKKAKDDPSLIASDGLHPSGKMYTQWVDQMYEHVFNNLSSR